MARQQLGPEFSDRVPRHIIAETVQDWSGWRDQHPVRRDPTIQAPQTFEPVSSRPMKVTQIAWKGFSIKQGQEWCYVPFLVARGGTQPLAGAPEEADLTQVMYRGEPMEHYTNIHRIENLARSHPLVELVIFHGGHRARDQSWPEFDTLGRCTSYHQSPYDLKLTLAATGATMYMGFTVHAVMHDLACIWWSPGRGMQNDTRGDVRDMARAIFLDLAEIAHQQPHLGTQLQRAWEQGANVRPTQQADAAAGSSGPATPRPASGGKGSSPAQPLALTAPADGRSPEDASSLPTGQAAAAGSSRLASLWRRFACCCPP